MAWWQEEPHLGDAKYPCEWAPSKKMAIKSTERTAVVVKCIFSFANQKFVSAVVGVLEQDSWSCSKFKILSRHCVCSWVLSYLDAFLVSMSEETFIPTPTRIESWEMRWNWDKEDILLIWCSTYSVLMTSIAHRLYGLVTAHIWNDDTQSYSTPISWW